MELVLEIIFTLWVEPRAVQEFGHFSKPAVEICLFCQKFFILFLEFTSQAPNIEVVYTCHMFFIGIY